MSQLRLYTDEDAFSAIAPALGSAGFDAVSTSDEGRLSESDDSQLQWATVYQRVIVTFNVGHFAALHSEWLTQSKHHCGIIVSSQRPIGDTVQRILNLAQTLDAEEMLDRLEFLSDW